MQPRQRHAEGLRGNDSFACAAIGNSTVAAAGKN